MATASMPKIALRGKEGVNFKAIRLQGRKLALEMGLLRLKRFGSKERRRRLPQARQAAIPKMIASSAIAGTPTLPR